ncbi:MAG TPA: PilZ domain-containing protein [Myxococcota bacterium]|jgi:hypothetical protein|nr:PilZ domain-containing protein [Myxococcota bacterium]
MAGVARVPDRRKFPREKHRVPCDLTIDGTVVTGFVTDLSPRGLFVQTAATADEGTAVSVRLREPDGETIVLQTRVVRLRRAHRAMVAVSTPGIGLEIVQAPETYYVMIQRHAH